VHFDAAPNLVYADPQGSIVTAGGTTSWHDLALHLIARHVNPGEARRMAKVYLLKCGVPPILWTPIRGSQG
jgi:transcriptional regulator GlxA family with amidase domain